MSDWFIHIQIGYMVNFFPVISDGPSILKNDDVDDKFEVLKA